jgi:sec-independent protein translocase protein TatA
MPNIGPFELIVILVIALVILGPGKLPEVGNALGKTIREFRRASTDVEDSMRVEPASSNAAAARPVTPSPSNAEGKAEMGEDRSAS